MRPVSARLFATTAALLTCTAALPADRAVVIGIDDYAALGLDRPIAGAKTDAERFAAFLEDSMGFAAEEITLLTDEDATSTSITTAVIDRLVIDTEPGDRAVFYFAGLGTRVATGMGSEPDGLDEALLAHDADAFLGKMPEGMFAEMLDRLDGRDVTVVIDASHTGDAGFMTGAPGSVRTRGIDLANTQGPTRGTVNETPVDQNAESFAERPFGSGTASRTVWAAAAPSQAAWEDTKGGVLTDAILDGLGRGFADANGNGTITNAEMQSYLTAWMGDWCDITPACDSTGKGLAPHFDGDPGHVLHRIEARPAALDGIEGTPGATPDSAAETDDLPGSGDREAMIGFVSDLFSPNNAASLKLRIDGPEPLRIGDRVTFHARAERDGTLVLLDINSNGELAQIYPSRLAPDGATQMTASEILTVPNRLGLNGLPLEIRVSEPAGEGFLLALFVESDLPTLEAVLPDNLAGGPIPDAMTYLFDIAQDLLALQANSDGNAAVDWSAVYLPYEILP